MGRRRKKYKKVVKRIKKIPDIFQCPHCSMKTLTIKFDKINVPGFKLAKITCGTCGLYAEMQVPDIYENVDVYAKFLDRYEAGDIEVEFRKISEAGEVVGESS
ncbi:MAG: hypothetical protein B6U89_00050 [Desulfurococcales archaeon ex4484_58]|nr:MAG: hypothetical protein B6U89_00050 [Desulfurococcales archaeon ex4484_58]